MREESTRAQELKGADTPWGILYDHRVGSFVTKLTTTHLYTKGFAMKQREELYTHISIKPPEQFEFESWEDRPSTLTSCRFFWST